MDVLPPEQEFMFLRCLATFSWIGICVCQVLVLPPEQKYVLVRVLVLPPEQGYMYLSGTLTSPEQGYMFLNCVLYLCGSSLIEMVLGFPPFTVTNVGLPTWKPLVKYVTWCAQVYSLAETPQLPPSPRIWTRITRALLVCKDRRHLFVTPCWKPIH